MKKLFGFVIGLVFVGLVIGFSISGTTEAGSAPLKEASVTVVPMAGKVIVTITCPGVPEGTVASITATKGTCVNNCRGTGGRATFDKNGVAKTTLDTTCTGGTADLTGCEFTAYWSEGSVNPKFKATVTPMSGHAGDYQLNISCEK